MTKRVYRYRIYPTADQEHILAKTFGCARFIFNHMLNVRKTAWEEHKKSISYSDTSKLLTFLKKKPEYNWLKEVSSVPIQQSLMHLNTAFTNFFENRSGYPKFKQSATFCWTVI
jgi:putative transposase